MMHSLKKVTKKVTTFEFSLAASWVTWYFCHVLSCNNPPEPED